MNLINCLTGFVKRRAKKYTNAQLSHVFTRYFQNLWFGRTHFFEPVQFRYRLVLIDIEMCTKKQTFMQSFIQSYHTNVNWLLPGIHFIKMKAEVLFWLAKDSKLQICKVSFGLALLKSVLSLLKIALLYTEQILICKSTQLF